MHSTKRAANRMQLMKMQLMKDDICFDIFTIVMVPKKHILVSRGVQIDYAVCAKLLVQGFMIYELLPSFSANITRSHFLT